MFLTQLSPQFLDQAIVNDRNNPGYTAGQLAQSVQRSEFPDRVCSISSCCVFFLADFGFFSTTKPSQPPKTSSTRPRPRSVEPTLELETAAALLRTAQLQSTLEGKSAHMEGKSEKHTCPEINRSYSDDIDTCGRPSGGRSTRPPALAELVCGRMGVPAR
jgi:hypothetical protein